MIHVLATIQLKPDTRDAFLQIFNELVPDVLNEDGCIDYFPAIDVKTDLENQPTDADSVTVLEKWDSVDALAAHLKAPHMATFKVRVKDILLNVSVKVLKKT